MKFREYSSMQYIEHLCEVERITYSTNFHISRIYRVKDLPFEWNKTKHLTKSEVKKDPYHLIFLRLEGV